MACHTNSVESTKIAVVARGRYGLSGPQIHFGLHVFCANFDLILVTLLANVKYPKLVILPPNLAGERF